MNYLYQPTYEYSKDVFGERINYSFTSSIVYETEERARLCALDTWYVIKSDNETLLNIEIRQLTIG